MLLAKNNWATPKAEISASLYWSLAGLAFFLLLAVWSLLTYGGWVPPLFLPAPDAIISSGVQLFMEFDLIKDIGASVWRVTTGFLAAAAIGVRRLFCLSMIFSENRFLLLGIML